MTQSLASCQNQQGTSHSQRGRAGSPCAPGVECPPRGLWLGTLYRATSGVRSSEVQSHFEENEKGRRSLCESCPMRDRLSLQSWGPQHWGWDCPPVGRAWPGRGDCFQECLTLLQVTEDPEELLFTWPCVLLFIILEMKIEI